MLCPGSGQLRRVGKARTEEPWGAPKTGGRYSRRAGDSQLLQLTSLATEGLCTCFISRERSQVTAVLL